MKAISGLSTRRSVQQPAQSCAPTVWAKLQHVTMMLQAVEHGAPGCSIGEQFAHSDT
jgi:hypothetical protein